MLAAATVANIKRCYDAKTPQFAIFGTRVIFVFYGTQYLVQLPNKGRSCITSDIHYMFISLTFMLLAANLGSTE